MKKLIALSENLNDKTILGIVVKDPFYDLAKDTFSSFGFKPKKQIKETVIMKSESFIPNILNDFSMHSGLDSDFFSYFICNDEQLEEILNFIENDT